MRIFNEDTEGLKNMISSRVSWRMLNFTITVMATIITKNGEKWRPQDAKNGYRSISEK